MNALGSHLLVDLKDCKTDILNDMQKVKQVMVEATENCGATIVDVSFHKFNPFGISGMVIIAESHLSIHTWPEYNFAAVDIFTCGELIKPQEAAAYLIEKFDCQNPSIMEMKRGILSPTDDRRLPHKGSPAEFQQSN